MAPLVGAILGPLVDGGASIYATHEESKNDRKLLQQRQLEAQQAQELARQQLEAQQREADLVRQVALQRSAAAQATLRGVAPYVGIGLGLLGLGVVVAKIVRASRGA